MAAALPFKTTKYLVAGTPAEQSHVFDDDCTEAVVQARDGNFTVGAATGVLNYTILSGDKLGFENANLARRTLYFLGATAGKYLEIIEVLGQAE